jgi:hypothetical protein
MEREISRRTLLRTAAGAVGAFAAHGLFLNERAEHSNAIELENAKPGAFGWLSPRVDAQLRAHHAKQEGRREAGQAEGVDIGALQRVEGYVDSPSVNTGQTISLRVRSALGAYQVSFLRMGFYGGAGAHEVLRTTTISGVNYAIPGWDTNGMIACNWPVALTQATTGWTSGYYLAALIPNSTGVAESYVPFVVRNDLGGAPILMQIPFTTYQAYNGWGGKNLYGGADGVRAKKVSFDRPYEANGGTQYLFAGDQQMILWLEKNGYDVSYATSHDTHTNASLMDGRRVFLSVYHDEYWSQTMRNNLTSWIGAARNVGFLSANNLYWRVRFEPSTAGASNRVMACYKDPALDPNTSEPTILFSEVGQSESQIEGIEFSSFGDVNAPWVVTNANHWIYAGTGVSNGTQIAGLVGTEWDGQAPVTPAGTTIIAASPTTGAYGPSVQAAAIRETASGGVVFDAGTIRFPMLLGGAYSPGEDARVARMVQNFFSRTAAPQTGGPLPTYHPPTPGGIPAPPTTRPPNDFVPPRVPTTTTTTTTIPTTTTTTSTTTTTTTTTTIATLPPTTSTTTAPPDRKNPRGGQPDKSNDRGNGRKRDQPRRP